MNTEAKLLRLPILVVEDSDEDFEALQRIHKHSALEHPIYRCATGDEALDYLHRRGRYQDPAHAPRPALIMLDLNLPGTDGREVLEQIKHDAALKTIPVVVLTTSSSPKDIDECYRKGANSYQTKAVDFDRFKAAILGLLQYWFRVSLLPPPAPRLV